MLTIDPDQVQRLQNRQCQDWQLHKIVCSLGADARSVFHPLLSTNTLSHEPDILNDVLKIVNPQIVDNKLGERPVEMCVAHNL